MEEGRGGAGLHTATGFIAAAPHLLITISSLPCALCARFPNISHKTLNIRKKNLLSNAAI